MKPTIMICMIAMAAFSCRLKESGPSDLAASNGLPSLTTKSAQPSQHQYPKFYGQDFLASGAASLNWAYCGDQFYVVGVSGNSRILCAQDSKPFKTPGWNPNDGHLVESYDKTKSRFSKTDYDWAHGRNKLECPIGSFMAGLTVETDRDYNSFGIVRIYCLKNYERKMEPQATACETVWFDRSAVAQYALNVEAGAEFRSSPRYGECKPGSYVAGIAVNREWVMANVDYPHALLCCPKN